MNSQSVVLRDILTKNAPVSPLKQFMRLGLLQFTPGATNYTLKRNSTTSPSAMM